MHPFARTWWITPDRLLGGCFPGAPDAAQADLRLRALLDAGVTQVLCLQEEGELGSQGRPFAPYEVRLRQLALARGLELAWERFPTRDMTAPTEATVRAVLERVRAAPGATYVHCWGGHGRTGAVAGCWYRELGLDPEDALDAIREARRHDPYLREQPSPQTPDQHELIRRWRAR